MLLFTFSSCSEQVENINNHKCVYRLSYPITHTYNLMWELEYSPQCINMINIMTIIMIPNR